MDFSSVWFHQKLSTIRRPFPTLKYRTARDDGAQRAPIFAMGASLGRVVDESLLAALVALEQETRRRH
jgi:hypothetical protein